MDQYISEIGRLKAALSVAQADLRAISSWRKKAHAHDDEMQYPQREFSDVEDWETLETHAGNCADRARDALTKAPQLPETTHNDLLSMLTAVRLNYAGAVNLLARTATSLDPGSETVDCIESAVRDFCELTGWTYSRFHNHFCLNAPKEFA